jgi:hypothetical protein
MWWTSSADAKRLSAPVVVEVLPVDDEGTRAARQQGLGVSTPLGSPELKAA